MKRTYRRTSWVTGAAMAILLSPGLALAGPEEQAFLQSYVGGWKGTGTLQSADGETEDFVCRVTVTRGRADKINYAGRCSVAGLNLSVAGTIAYVEAAQRYEAAMSSNASFTGVAIGRKVGDRVVFDLRERETSDEGKDLTITSQVSLGDEDIGLRFTYTGGDADERTDAEVTFARLAN